jgi:hypothetical protein
MSSDSDSDLDEQEDDSDEETKRIKSYKRWKIKGRSYRRRNYRKSWKNRRNS